MAEYRVLARKYRPASFDTLLGQDAMVRTLGNAIARQQIAQAWLLTGVRGVGKTSTARIIAKALNCIGPDAAGGPTITPCGICDPCTAGKHVIHVRTASHADGNCGHLRVLYRSPLIGNDINRLLDLSGAVRGGDEETDASLVVWDSRMKNRLGVDSRMKEPFG